MNDVIYVEDNYNQADTIRKLQEEVKHLKDENEKFRSDIIKWQESELARLEQEKCNLEFRVKYQECCNKIKKEIEEKYASIRWCCTPY